MKTVIYVDVLLGINFIIAYYLLLAAKHLSGSQGSGLRLVLGSALAALSSLMLLLPPMPVLLSILAKLTFCMASVRLALRNTGWRNFAKATGWFFLLNFLLAGVVFFAVFTFSASGVRQNNLAVYFNVSPWLLLFSVLTVYLVLELFSLLFHPPHSELALELRCLVGTAHLTAHTLYDTGFSVKDMLTGHPCVLVSLPEVQRDLPDFIAVALQAYFADGSLGEGLRLLPCATAGGKSLLPALSCKDAVLYSENKQVDFPELTLLFTPERLGGGQYAALTGSMAAGALI